VGVKYMNQHYVKDIGILIINKDLIILYKYNILLLSIHGNQRSISSTYKRMDWC
jgi:hypothetical protein